MLLEWNVSLMKIA